MMDLNRRYALRLASRRRRRKDALARWRCRDSIDSVRRRSSETFIKLMTSDHSDRLQQICEAERDNERAWGFLG